MGGPLITLPLRVGVRSTQLMLRAGEELLTRATALAGHAVQAVAQDRSAAPRATPERERSADSPSAKTAPSPGRPARRSAERIPHQPAQPTSPQTGEPSPPQPVHVSEEPELVGELAEPGAEDGAGAEVTVAEPWQGYAGMSAKEVIARLGAATPAELAAVKLYESGNRGRQTVLAAVERGLKTTTGRARQTRKEQASA